MTRAILEGSAPAGAPVTNPLVQGGIRHDSPVRRLEGAGADRAEGIGVRRLGETNRDGGHDARPRAAAVPRLEICLRVETLSGECAT